MMCELICAPSGRGKTYADLMIDQVKKYGILQLWYQWCIENEMYIITERSQLNEENLLCNF